MYSYDSIFNVQYSILFVSPPGGTYVVLIDVIVGVLEVEVHVVDTVGSTVERVSTVHVRIVGRGGNVRWTGLLHQLGGRDVGHVDLQCAVECGVTVLHQFLETVAAGGPGVGTEDRAVGQVVIGRPVIMEYQFDLT